MKRIIFIHIFILITLLACSSAKAQTAPTTGRVVDSSNAPISYATVTLSSKDEQKGGTTTDDEGLFMLQVEEGEYQILVSYVGYKSHRATITAPAKLDTITLSPEATQIDNVVVTSNFIRRDADRFVVDVANAPASIGQNGEELLKSAPGVWIADDKISINGNSSPNIYVNDRELKMSDEQIMTYLRSLKSSEVRRIEVIPQSGADFDASSASGIIMIYLKRQLSSGVVGNVSLSSAYNNHLTNISPSGAINYQSEKLTLNTSGWYNRFDYDSWIDTKATYNTYGATLTETISDQTQSTSGGGRIEAIYQFNDRHSIGAEINTFTKGSDATSLSNSAIDLSGMSSLSNSSYISAEDSRNLSATFNYIYKLDSLGSTLKLLADYNLNSSTGNNDNITTTQTIDSLYNSRSSADFSVATITLAAEKIISPKLTLKGGAKYTHNDMDSRSNYTYLDEDQWQELPSYNSDELYTENIGATYLIGSSRIGRWAIVAGLRGEYTQTAGRDNILDKNYMSWFPNINASYMLNQTGTHMLSTQLSRSIKRPNFWSLNPNRTQTSQYSYTIGNPSLRPEYSTTASLTYIYKYKYSLTATLKRANDSVQQIFIQDDEDPNMTYIMHENMKSQHDFYLTASLPFQIKEWWSLSANLSYINRGEQICSEDHMSYQNILIANAQSTFTLPHSFFLNLSYFGMSSAKSGNIEVAPRHWASVSLNKRFCDDKFTAALSAHNLFSTDSIITSTTDSVNQQMTIGNGWSTPRIGLSLTYNFKSGKQHTQRQGIESASPEDRARLTSDSDK